jgi:hypothetical protein
MEQLVDSISNLTVSPKKEDHANTIKEIKKAYADKFTHKGGLAIANTNVFSMGVTRIIPGYLGSIKDSKVLSKDAYSMISNVSWDDKNKERLGRIHDSGMSLILALMRSGMDVIECEFDVGLEQFVLRTHPGIAEKKHLFAIPVGKIDMIAIDKNTGDLVLIDLKTTKTQSSVPETYVKLKYAMQLEMYALLLELMAEAIGMPNLKVAYTILLVWDVNPTLKNNEGHCWAHKIPRDPKRILGGQFDGLSMLAADVLSISKKSEIIEDITGIKTPHKYKFVPKQKQYQSTNITGSPPVVKKSSITTTSPVLKPITKQ